MTCSIWSTILGKATSGWAALTVVVLIALYRTNPNAIQHFQKLYSRPIPIELVKSGTEVPEIGLLGAFMAKSPFDWHDYILFSTTTNRVTGARGSVGIFGKVFDARTQVHRDEEWCEANRESSDRMFQGIAASLERNAKLLDLGDPFKHDYLSRGCVIEDNNGP